MIRTNELKNFQIMRQRTSLPDGTPDKKKGSVVFLNNPEVNLDAIQSDKVRINRNYKLFYMDRIIRRRMFNRMRVFMDANIRKNKYSQAKEKYNFLSTPQTFNTINGRNVYFDLSMWNELYNDSLAYTSQNYKRRIKEYVNILIDLVNDERWRSYNQKTMLIDVESWGGLLGKFIGRETFLTSPWMMFYYLIWKDIDTFKQLGDLDIILHTDNAIMKINPKETSPEDLVKFRQTLKRFSRYTDVPEDIEHRIKSYDASSSANPALRLTEDKDIDIRYLTGEKISPDVVKDVKKVIDEVSERNVEKSINGATKKDMGDDYFTDTKDDPAINKAVEELIRKEKGAATTRSTKRDEELRKQQEGLRKEFTDKDVVEIPTFDVYDKIDSTNSNVAQIRYANFDKTYNDTMLDKDIFNAFSSLNNAEIPVYIRDYKIEDASDEMNSVNTLTVSLEDENRVRHTVKVDVPVFVEDKFLYLNGNRKSINKQLMMKPVVKTGPSEVQVVSNYNKIFIRRTGSKLSKKTEKLRKVLSTDYTGINVTLGSSDVKNIKYLTTIEYDELSKNFSSIRVGKKTLYFDQQTVLEMIEKKDIKIPEGKMCIGFEGPTPILVDLDTQLVSDTNLDIVDYIVTNSSSKLQEDYNKTTTGKVFMYSEATIMAKKVPVILLLCYLEGISTVLRKANIKHRFSETRPRLGDNEESVQFADGYLIYDKHPTENSILMNGIHQVPVKGFNYEDLDSKETYSDIFDSMYGQRNISSAFDNFYDFMIDPVTHEVLTDLGYPTDFVSLIIFANSLLTDSSYVNENDMSLYRIRSSEIIYVYLYKALTSAYGNYRRTAYNNNPTKISIKPDSITKELLTARTVEDYSVLNPIVELEKVRAASTKGPSGMNLEQGYTLDKRAYDPSMLGIIGISTSPDKNVGIARQLTLEPNIKNPRGYLEIKNDKVDELNDANLFSPAELLSPLGASRDELLSPRMGTSDVKLF